MNDFAMDSSSSVFVKLDENLEIHELVERLKTLAETLKCYSVRNDAFILKPLAELLASNIYLEHSCPDVQLLVASCISDIFRLSAPQSLYDKGQLKHIFSMFTNVLRHLSKKRSSRFKHYLHLFQNLAESKVFTLCFDLREQDDVVNAVFTCLIDVSDKQSPSLSAVILDILTPLINDVDAVTTDVLDLILRCLLKPVKSENKAAYHLVRNLVLRTSKALEQPIWKFFSSALQSSQSSVDALHLPVTDVFDLIEELDSICPALLEFVYPQLQSTLESDDENVRILGTHLLGKLFGKPNSSLAEQHKCLWFCFVDRFSDRSIAVRRSCIQASQGLISYHRELVMKKSNGHSICDHLCLCDHDPNDYIRIDAIRCITGAAQLDVNSINEPLLDYVKCRLLDKKDIVCQEAAEGLAIIFKCYQEENNIKQLVGIQNAVLHSYASASSVNKRHTLACLFRKVFLSGNLEPESRMRLLLMLYCALDDVSLKSFQEILRMQYGFKTSFASLLEQCRRRGTNTSSIDINNAIAHILRCLSISPNSCIKLKTFLQSVVQDSKLYRKLLFLLSSNISSPDVDDCVAEVVKHVPCAVSDVVEQLLGKLTLFVITKTEILALTRKLHHLAFTELSDTDDMALISVATISGVKLLLVFSNYFYESFDEEETYAKLLSMIQCKAISEIVIQIFKNCGNNLKKFFPSIYEELMPSLFALITDGSSRQSKHAIYCVATLTKNHSDCVLQPVFEKLRASLDVHSLNLATSLVTLGHIMLVCPSSFTEDYGPKIKDFVDEQLFQHKLRSGLKEEDTGRNLISTVVQIQGLKAVMRWLMGIKTGKAELITSAIQIFYSILYADIESSHVLSSSANEAASLRLQAGCCLLKVAQNPVCEECITPHHFQILALLMNDPCFKVRSNFASKLNKALQSLRLPLSYMSFFCLGALDPEVRQEAAVKKMLKVNIALRRDYMRRNSVNKTKVLSVLPEYVLPYAIHLLAHDPHLTSHTDLQGLQLVKQCLSFLLEALFPKNDCTGVAFCKQICQNIPFAKDQQSPKSITAKAKLYAVCELALNELIKKEIPDALAELPAKPVLPTKLFTRPYSANKWKRLSLNEQIERPFRPVSSERGSYVTTDSHELLPVLSSVSSNHTKRPARKTGTTKTLNLDNTKSFVQHSSAEVGFHSTYVNMESSNNSCISIPLNSSFSQSKRRVQNMNSMTFIENVNSPYDPDVPISEKLYNSSGPQIDNQRQILPVPNSLSGNSDILSLVTPSFKDFTCDYSLTLPSSLNVQLLLTQNLSNQNSPASEVLPSADGKINASENESQISIIASQCSSIPSSTEVIHGPQIGSFISSPTLCHNDIMISPCASNQTHAYEIPTFHDCIPNTQLEVLSHQETGHFHANETSVLPKETIEAISEQQNVHGSEKYNHVESGDFDPANESSHIVQNQRLSTVISDLLSATMSFGTDKIMSSPSQEADISVLEYIDNLMATKHKMSSGKSDEWELVGYTKLVDIEKEPSPVSNKHLDTNTIVKAAAASNDLSLSRYNTALGTEKNDFPVNNNEETEFVLFEDLIEREECLLFDKVIPETNLEDQNNHELDKLFPCENENLLKVPESQIKACSKKPTSVKDGNKIADTRSSEMFNPETIVSSLREESPEQNESYQKHLHLMDSQIAISDNSRLAVQLDGSVKCLSFSSDIMASIQLESAIDNLDSCVNSLETKRCLSAEHCTTAHRIHMSQSCTALTPVLGTNGGGKSSTSSMIMKLENDTKMIQRKFSQLFCDGNMMINKMDVTDLLDHASIIGSKELSGIDDSRLKIKSSVPVSDLSLCSPNKKTMENESCDCMEKNSSNNSWTQSEVESPTYHNLQHYNVSVIDEDTACSFAEIPQCTDMPSKEHQCNQKFLEQGIAITILDGTSLATSTALERNDLSPSATIKSSAITAISSVENQCLSVTASHSNSIKVCGKTSTSVRNDTCLTVFGTCTLKADVERCRTTEEICTLNHLQCTPRLASQTDKNLIQGNASSLSEKEVTMSKGRASRERNLQPEGDVPNSYNSFSTNEPPLQASSGGNRFVSVTENKDNLVTRQQNSVCKHSVTGQNFIQHSKFNNTNNRLTGMGDLKSMTKILPYKGLHPKRNAENATHPETLPGNLISTHASEPVVSLIHKDTNHRLGSGWKSEATKFHNADTFSATNALNTFNEEIKVPVCVSMPRHASMPVVNFTRSLFSLAENNKQVKSKSPFVDFSQAPNKMTNFMNSEPEKVNQCTRKTNMTTGKNRKKINPILKNRHKVCKRVKNVRTMSEAIMPVMNWSRNYKSASHIQCSLALSSDEPHCHALASDVVNCIKVLNHQLLPISNSSLQSQQIHENDLTEKLQKTNIVTELEGVGATKASKNETEFRVQDMIQGDDIFKPKCSVVQQRMMATE